MLAAILVFRPERWSWWPTVAVGVVAVALLMITVYRRNAVRWIVDRVRWRRRRRRTDSPAAAVDIPHGPSLYGVRVPDRFDGEAMTMVEVTGQAYSPTLLTGSATALTPNRLPLDALTELLEDQPGGIRLSGIDVVSSGLRVRRGTGYPPLYSTLLADRPAAGQRENLSGCAPGHRQLGDRTGLPDRRSVQRRLRRPNASSTPFFSAACGPNR